MINLLNLRICEYRKSKTVMILHYVFVTDCCLMNVLACPKLTKSCAANLNMNMGIPLQGWWLFCFVKCVLNILKQSRTRCIMNLHTSHRQVLGEALSSNTDKEYLREQF